VGKSKSSRSKNEGRVLILDDEPESCRVISSLVEGLGFDVDTSTDAALVYLDKLNDSDIIFIDIQMPGMDGLQVLEVLSRRNGKSGIILMSDTNEELAGAVAMSKERGLKLIGALIKPFDLKQVKEVLQCA
jgi:CheY-like chemotaxis protein